MNWPSGSPGDRVWGALLPRFRTANAMERFLPTAAKLDDAKRVRAIGQLQLGAKEMDRPQCRRWVQGIWTTSPKQAPGAILGGSFLVDNSEGVFWGIRANETIIHARPGTLDSLIAARPPKECHELELSDTSQKWTTNVQELTLVNPVGEKAWAYARVDVSGRTPTVWTALTRYRDLLIEVKLIVMGAKHDPRGQQAMLEELLAKAVGRARSASR